MSLFFKDTEITNIDNLVPQTGLDITDMWFGTTNVFTVWAVYEGTLPATLNANGDYMRQYQIYGNTGGVGDVTETGEPAGYKIPCETRNLSKNLENATITTIYIGSDPLGKDEYVDYAEQKVYRNSEELWDVNGTTTNQNGDTRSGNEFPAGNTYCVINANVVRGMVFYRLGVTSTSATHIPPKANLTIEAAGDLVIWCAASTYMPNISVKRIHIPTDPPVALPALPTAEGETVVDYAGKSQATPEKVLLKYRKEGF